MPTVRIPKVFDRQEIGRILVIEGATNNDTSGVFRDPTGWGRMAARWGQRTLVYWR